MALTLSVEVTGWAVSQQIMQRTADMTALAAAEAYQNGLTVQQAATVGASAAEMNGASGQSLRLWAPGSPTSTLTDNTITVAVTTSLPAKVVATIAQTVPFQLAGIANVRGVGQALVASSTAELVPGPLGKYCVLALDPTSGDVGVNMNNGATVNTASCGVQVDTPGSAGLTVTGGATLISTNLAVAGPSYTTSQGGAVTATHLITSAPAIANPYAGIAVPTPGSCYTVNGIQVTGYNQNATVSPGATGTLTYCGGLSIGSNATVHVTLNAGIYIIYGGNFFVGAGSTLTATAGVTIVLTGDENYPNHGNTHPNGIVQIGNGTTVSITAPTSGPTAGIAIYQGATDSQIDGLQGGATMVINGALLFPNHTVQFSNGVSNTGGCTQLIAYQIQFAGAADFSNNCTGTGTTPIGPPTTVALVQ